MGLIAALTRAVAVRAVGAGMALAFVCLIAIGHSVSGAQASRLLVLGDSLSAAYGFDEAQGWVALLNQRLSERNYDFEVINASLSGETTEGALARFPALLDEHRPAIVLVELGANDGLRGFPLGVTEGNLERITTLARDAGARVALLEMRIPPNYGPRYADEFQAIYARLARVEDVVLVPFFLDGVAGDRAFIQDDGLHPTATAQPTLLENVWPALEPLLGEPD